MPFNSNHVQMVEIHRNIAKRSLRAAAIEVQNEAKRIARGGFKTGDWVTNGWTTIQHRVEMGALSGYAEVGSTLDHFAYWEFGHKNVLTGQYERNRWLTKAFQNTKMQQRAAAKRAAVEETKDAAVAVLSSRVLLTILGSR